MIPEILLLSTLIFANGFEAEDTGPPQPETCHSSMDPLNLPVGFIGHSDLTPRRISWELAFFGNTYPSSGAPLAPLGSFTLRQWDKPSGPPIAGKWIAVPFTPSNGVYLLNWLQTQPIYENGYYNARVAKWVYVTISECPGDFRLVDNTPGKDDFLRSACRKISGSTTLYYSANYTGFNVCKVTAGRKHYLNFLFADPRDGLTNTEHSCLGGQTRCEVNTRHEQQSAAKIKQLEQFGIIKEIK